MEAAAAAAEKQAGRSTGPVDRHAQHAQGHRRSTGPVDRNTLTVRAKLSVNFGRPTGRPERRSVDQIGRPTVGFGRKSAVPQIAEQQGI